MDAILATSSNNVIYQKQTFARPLRPWENPGDQFETKNVIPWLGEFEYALDMAIFKAFTKDKIIWCTWGTYQTLPLKVKFDPTRAFKILSKKRMGFTANPWFSTPPLRPNHITTYSFQDLHNALKNLGSNHVLIGGPSAYQEFLGHCENVLWTTIKCNYNGDNVYFDKELPFHYDPTIYKSSHMDVTLYYKSLTGYQKARQSLPI